MNKLLILGATYHEIDIVERAHNKGYMSLSQIIISTGQKARLNMLQMKPGILAGAI